MFGDLALKLVQEARAAQVNQTLPPYNDELIRLILLETRQLHAHISKLLESGSNVEQDEGLAAQLVTHHAAAQRNKRCLLAYQNCRLEFIKSVVWQKGGSLDLALNHVIEIPGHASDTQQKTTLRSRLSPSEVDFIRGYAQLNLAYKTDFLDIVDVAAPLQRTLRADDVGPIRELMVSVVSNVDARDVQTERGSVTLRKGNRMRVLRSEIENLITRGWLTVVDD